MNIPLSDAKQKIAEFSPQFELQSLKLLGSGTDSTAYLANDQWIFRFPKSNAAQKTLKKEIVLLPQLRNHLPIAIPDFKYIAKDTDKLLYVCYQMLPGVPLEKNIFDTMPIQKQEQALKDLTRFLQILHKFPIQTASECRVQKELYKGAYHSEQKLLLREIQHLLSKEEISKIENIFSSYEKDEKNISNPLSILHADLKPDHILYDPETGHITGIIDWGDVCIGDPDFDFTCLSLFYDQDFVVRLLKYFPTENREHILTKIQFFITIRWLQDLADFVKSKDEQFIAFCLTELRKHLQYVAQQ